ncbi:MAG: DUF3052 domain-containing protein [Clostridia bacterium]|nr:DUF3052 domain-containing protein [Clostridia bacterium]
MSDVLKKLKLTNQNPVLVLNAPEEYKDTMSEIKSDIHTSINGKYGFIQVFVKDLSQLNKYIKDVIEALDGDGYLWVCYPKGTSKKYKSDVNRNTLIEAFGPYDFEGVTQIAIDDDWSAIRVKNVDNIKTMKRKTAMSEKGKERIQGNNDIC